MFIAGHTGISLVVAKVTNRYLFKGKMLVNNLLWIFLCGALFPDIIDKPLGILVHNGRTICHTFLLFAVVIIIGLALAIKGKKIGMLVFGFGWFMHLLLDSIWMFSNTFWWPFCGPFMSYPGHWFSWKALLNPSVYIPEILGLIFIIGIVIRDAFKRNRKAP